MPRHKQYHFYAEQYSQVRSQIRMCEDRLLEAWENGDGHQAAHFETEISRWNRVVEGLDFSVQNNTVGRTQ